MSKLIAKLLGADQRNFANTIERLEKMSLHPGVDTKLTAEIITQVREKSRRLMLDPADTTKEELYYGLLAKARLDDLSIRQKIGISDKTLPVAASKYIASNTEKLLKKDIVICMQPATVKKILRAIPPKRTMRALRFRSIESVLKREDPLALYALAKRLEDKSWHTQIEARMKRLQPRDAKESHVQVLSLSNDWLEKLNKVSFDSVLQPVPEIGCVLILPTMPLSVAGSVLLTTCLVLQAGQRLAIESLPFRNQALNRGYEKLLPDIASGVFNEIKPIHGLRPSWHAVFQLLAERGHDSSSDFEFIIGDLEWQSTETRLASLASELDFWVNSHYLGYVTEDRPLSLHLVDVVASLVLEKSYGYQITSHLQASLWNELQLRYLKQENIERNVISQLTMAQEIML
jgi:hypothetical protein